MLSAGLVPEERKQEYLDTLNRESARLSTMVESVLEYARLENRHAKLHLRETDPNSLLQTVGETLDKRCSENGIEGRKVNEIKEGLKIRTDVDLVSQITGVLVNNAVRHARTSKQPRVTLRLGGDNGKLMVDVTDSGPGVDRSDSRRIFRPFRRGRDADSAARGGIGLGLALARDWASLLGGRLDLVHRHDPELGGAHFRLTIPSRAGDA
jgi:signal transduction histidine kinase